MARNIQVRDLLPGHVVFLENGERRCVKGLELGDDLVGGDGLKTARARKVTFENGDVRIEHPATVFKSPDLT